jgi:hypothetical protein
VNEVAIKPPIAKPLTNFPAKNTGDVIATTSSVIPTAENTKATENDNFRPILSAIHPAAIDPKTALPDISISLTPSI